MSAKRAGIVAFAAAAGACALGLKALNAKQRQEEERAAQHAIGKLKDIIDILTVQIAEGQTALQEEIARGQKAVQQEVAEGQKRLLGLAGQLQAAEAALQHLQQEFSAEQEQARDAANKWQQTETARLQLEGLLGQALLARAELLQQRNALSVEKQGLQDSCASLEEGLSAKEVEVQLAQRQASDAAIQQQRTEAARLQLEREQDQAVQARAVLLQQNSALRVEKQGLQEVLRAKEVEVHLAQGQASDAAIQQQRTEAARLQLEREQDQAVQARAVLLQQNSALRVEKQGLQEVLRAKEEDVERLTGRLGVAETALGQLSQTSDAALLALRDQLSAEEAGHAAALAALEQQAMQHQAEVQQLTGRPEAAQHSQAAEVQQNALLRSQAQGLSEELEGKRADVRALNASTQLLGRTIADPEIDRSDLSARLSQEERRSFTAGEEHVAATQSIADLQGAVAQLLEAVGSSQGHLQQELLKSKRCHVKEMTSLHEKASSVRDELKEQLKAALSDKLQANQALEKLQREHEEQLGGLKKEATSTVEELAAVKKKLQSVGGRVNAMVAELQSEVDSLKQEKEAAVSQLRNELAQKEQEAQQVQERLNALAKEREELQSSNSGLQKELRTQGKQLEDEQSSVEEAKQAAVEAGAILQMEQERRAAAYSQLAACQDNNAGLQQQLSHAMEAYGCATQANNALLAEREVTLWRADGPTWNPQVDAVHRLLTSTAAWRDIRRQLQDAAWAALPAPPQAVAAEPAAASASPVQGLSHTPHTGASPATAPQTASPASSVPEAKSVLAAAVLVGSQPGSPTRGSPRIQAVGRPASQQAGPTGGPHFSHDKNDANLAAQGTQALSQGTQPLPQGNQTNASAVPPGLAPPVAGNAGGRVQIKKKAAAQKNEEWALMCMTDIKAELAELSGEEAASLYECLLASTPEAQARDFLLCVLDGRDGAEEFIKLSWRQLAGARKRYHARRRRQAQN